MTDKAMCTETAAEIVSLREQLAKATQNMRLIEDARREAFKDGYLAAFDNHGNEETHVSVINAEIRQAMMERGYVPLDG